MLPFTHSFNHSRRIRFDGRVAFLAMAKCAKHEHHRSTTLRQNGNDSIIWSVGSKFERDAHLNSAEVCFAQITL